MSMPKQDSQDAAAGHFSSLLKHWRSVRRLTQIELAVDANVSARHLCFLETGRSQPSRAMVQLLGSALDLPLEERNALHVAAGFVPPYGDKGLAADNLQPVQQALDFMLRQQEPYPAIAVDRTWTILKANNGAVKLVETFADPAAADEWGGNAMRLMFHPRGFRPHIVNWEAMAAALIQWLHRDVLSGLGGAETRKLLDELLSYPGVPPRWRTLDLDVSTAPFLAIEFRKGDLNVRFFSTLTSLGTPHDITLQELRVEAFFPADAESEEAARSLVSRA